MSAGNRLRGLWLQWPQLDVLVPAFAVALWLLAGAPVPPEGSRGALYTATSAAAGIGLAGAAFVCTIFYQVSDDLLQEIRNAFGPTIRRNWVWILSSLLAAVVLPVLAIVVDPISAPWAIALDIVASLAFVASFGRVIFWFHRTLGILDSPAGKPMSVTPKNLRP